MKGKVKRIGFGSKLYPLPEDYGELTREGQRQARVAACRQWMLRQETPEKKAKAFTASLQFFDEYYLWPDREADFDPGFYDMLPLPTPDMHWKSLEMWAKHRLCIEIDPRGSGKTTRVRKVVLRELVTCPKFSCVYATSSLSNVKNTAQALKEQFQPEVNERIAADWGEEYGSENGLKPGRGVAPWGNDLFQLKNGSQMQLRSADSKQRGLRPWVYYLDDPEFDEKESTSMEVLRMGMQRLLFNVVLPMTMRARCGVRWTATFVSKRHYAFHAMQVDGLGNAVDPRFNSWARMLVKAEGVNKEGEPVSCWPEMWPATMEEKKRLVEEDPERYEGVVSIPEMKEMLTLSVFRAEYMGEPGEGDDSFFPALDEKKHGWWVEGVDDLWGDEPWKSGAMVCWWERVEGKWRVKRMVASQFLSWATVFMTVDTSWTARKDSDWKVAGVFAVTPENDLMVMDLWEGKTQQGVLIRNTFGLAEKWHARQVFVEAIREGNTVYQTMVGMVGQRATDMAGSEWLPRVEKWNPGVTKKESRIAAALEPRFQHGKIKMPLSRRYEGAWGHLMDQVEGFNPEAHSGGLQHDDHLDVCAMAASVVRRRISGKRLEVVEEGKGPLERLMEGELVDPDTGLPMAYGVDWRGVEAEELLRARERARKAKHELGTGSGRGWNRSRA